MRALVTVLNSSFRMARAETPNGLAIFFRLPREDCVSMSDELDVNLERLDVEQDAINLTTGQPIRLKIDSFNVQDLSRPGSHFEVPSLSRRRAP